REEAHDRRGPRRRLHREARGDPDVPHDGPGRAHRRCPAQEDRHHRGDRERRVCRVDQALAREGLRHDDEHHAELRRTGHRVLPRAPYDEGPELEQLERARARRPARGGAADARPEKAQGDLRPRPDPDPRERPAPLALLRGHDRLHAGLREGFQAASDDPSLWLRGRLARPGLSVGLEREALTVGRYLVVRAYSMALTLLGLTVLVFLMLRLIPGTVVEQMIG